MEKLKLSISKQLSANPIAEAEIKDRLGKANFDTAVRTSEATLLELLEEGYADIGLIRNAVAYESAESAKPVLAASGIDSGMKLIWPEAYGDNIWENGLREPRLYTPFPKTARKGFESANALKKKAAPVPMINKVDEGLSKKEIDESLEFYSCGEANFLAGPAYFGYFNTQEVSGNWPRWRVGEWKAGKESGLAIDEYGLWVSARVREIFDSQEDSSLKRELETIIRTFKF